jgi:hypothetical protein
LVILEMVLPISASQVARITGVNHWCPVMSTFLDTLFLQTEVPRF